MVDWDVVEGMRSEDVVDRDVIEGMRSEGSRCWGRGKGGLSTPLLRAHHFGGRELIVLGEERAGERLRKRGREGGRENRPGLGGPAGSEYKRM